MANLGWLIEFKCSPKEADRYNIRFDGEDIAYLFKVRCPSKEADKYPGTYNGVEISDFFKVGGSPKKVKKYNNLRFNAKDITCLILSHCSPQEADKYNTRFNGSDIRCLFEVGCSPEETDKYDSNFSGLTISWLFEIDYSSEKANRYDKRFRNKNIFRLIKKDLLPEEANKYNKRFSVKEVACLAEIGCSPKKADKYNKKFNGFHISELFKRKYIPEEVSKYNPRFEGGDIVRLVEVGCSPEKADKYELRFNGWEISRLIEKNCSSERVKKFGKRFSGSVVCDLVEKGCSPEEANSYSKKFDDHQVYMLYRMGIKPNKFPKKKQEKLFNFLKNLLDSYILNLDYYKFHFLGTGISGIVLLKENAAWKFSEKISKEYLVLKKIHDYHKGNPKNVINLKGEPQGGKLILKKGQEKVKTPDIKSDLDSSIALEIMFIEGDSLENILQKNSPLPKNKIMKYSSDIMNGLIEMRQAGVWYHRDIRPANILIDKKNDKAVIVDFGIATTNRHALPKNNRRYGGVNDLISLGQLMYKMVSGKHIFAESKSMEKTTFAQNIKDYRDKIYSDGSGKFLKKHFQQIDKKIRDKKFRKLIKTCLTAKNYEYKKTQRLFSKLFS